MVENELGEINWCCPDMFQQYHCCLTVLMNYELRSKAYLKYCRNG